MMFSPFNGTYSYDPWNEYGRRDISYKDPSRMYYEFQEEEEEEEDQCNCARCEHERTRVCDCVNCRLSKRYVNLQKVLKKQPKVAPKKNRKDRNHPKLQTNIVATSNEAQNQIESSLNSNDNNNNKQTVNTNHALIENTNEYNIVDFKAEQTQPLEGSNNDNMPQSVLHSTTTQEDESVENTAMEKTTSQLNEPTQFINNNNNEDLPEKETNVADFLSKKLDAIKTVEENVEKIIEQFHIAKSSLKAKDLVYYEEMMVRNLIELDTILTDGNTEIRNARKQVVSNINNQLEIIESQKEDVKADKK